MLFALLLLPIMQDTPTPEEIETAAELIGLEFESEELEMMRRGIRNNRGGYEALRAVELENSVLPALTFSPLLPGMSIRKSALSAEPFALPDSSTLERPADLEQLAFASIPELAGLIRSRKVSCVELTEMYLGRLEDLDSKLHCVITLTSERALEQAKALDEELANGKWRGPLHGIPWGAKDLLAVDGYRTTWGAKPFEDQVIPMDATVVKRLDDAGAVLIAKLTLGSLAMGDVWYGEKTRSPWNLERGSSGSSAGSSSATAAGCVGFAIGSETLGSIVSPSTRCGNSSLRPTFGHVSRHGAMALSWSMDKLGPICRSVEDAAIVFDAIHGPDGLDPSVHEAEFRHLMKVDVTKLRIGYVKSAFERSKRDQHVLEELRALGVELIEFELPGQPLSAMDCILDAEAAAAFDAITRDGRDDELVRQSADAWPNLFRTARLVPAVEYINANRLRTQLMLDMHQAMESIDVYVHPSFGKTLFLTNLTGHPTVVCPSGFSDKGEPYSISFTGQLYDDETVLAVAQAWQESTGFHERHPDL